MPHFSRKKQVIAVLGFIEFICTVLLAELSPLILIIGIAIFLLIVLIGKVVQ